MPVTLSADDRLQIMELYAGYAWAVDAGDTDALMDLVTPEAVIYERRGDDIRHWHRRFMGDPAFPGSQHYVGQIRIVEQDGNQASVRAYVVRLHRIPGTTSASPIWLGYYTDLVVKVDGRWLFRMKAAHAAERQATQDLEQDAPPTEINKAAWDLYDLGAGPA